MSLVPYEGSSSDDESPEQLTKVDITSKLSTVQAAPYVDESLVIDYRLKNEFIPVIDPHKTKELAFNAKYDDLYAPEYGPQHPDKPQEHKNFVTGHIESTNINDVVFELERRAIHAAETEKRAQEKFLPPPPQPEGDQESGEGTTQQQSNKKRKKLKNNDPSDIDGYTGPWAQYKDEVKVCQPSEEDQAEIDAFNAKKKKYTMKLESAEDHQEKSNLHIQDPYDYQGRSFLHPPHDVDVNLKPDHVPDRCFIPKKLIHTYTGHSKAITKIRWFPKSGHLFLSSSMDGKVKLWESFKQRRCIMTFMGHKQAVRDICFNRFGDRFLSAGYDRALKLWDTETGQCVKRFNSRAVPYCIQFNPDEERSHLFLAGMANKKIACFDSRTGNICQEYDRHLGPVNTVTFVDNNRRFVSTSDDKSIRVWEWDIPVEIKYIADPGLHSVPAVSLSPTGKWIACQMMDNKIQAMACTSHSFKLSSKKIFSGHMVAGYSCTPVFSPDMSFLSSGDADGKVFIWDWKSCKLLTTFQAHDNVCINNLWHPHETSKLLTAGWDGLIKLWD